MMNTIWSVWSLFFSFITLLNLYFFFLELRDKGYRKHILIKIVIFILCFFIYRSIFLPILVAVFFDSFFIFVFLFFYFSIFIVFIILRKFITLNDMTLFFMFSLILFPISYNIGSKMVSTDEYFILFWLFDIVFLLSIGFVLFFINIVVQAIKTQDTSNLKTKTNPMNPKRYHFSNHSEFKNLDTLKILEKAMQEKKEDK